MHHRNCDRNVYNDDSRRLLYDNSIHRYIHSTITRSHLLHSSQCTFVSISAYIVSQTLDVPTDADSADGSARLIKYLSIDYNAIRFCVTDGCDTDTLVFGAHVYTTYLDIIEIT